MRLGYQQHYALPHCYKLLNFDMDMVPDDDTEGFSFIWTIQNFSYCFQKKGEPLSSPPFKLNLSDTNKWHLNLYPRGVEVDDTIGVYLIPSSGPLPIIVNKYISIRDTSGAFLKNRNENASVTFDTYVGCGSSCFINYSDLFKKENAAFMENDTLTLRCRIWKEFPELPLTGQCYARTVIDVKRIAFVWPLENFKELLHGETKNIKFHADSSQTQSFTMNICLSGGVHSERKIQITMTQDVQKTAGSGWRKLASVQKTFLTCKLSLLEADGKTAQSVREEYWSIEASQSTHNWNFTFMPVAKILDNEELYLANGTLSLRCEFAVSSGEKTDLVEKTEYGATVEHDTVRYKKIVHSSFLGSWKNTLRQVFEEGKFSDLIIRAESGKEFPVHKAILCARSKVFRAMFEHDTKENQTGVVEIQDLSDDTVSKLLLYIYTDILEDVQCEIALELYFAAAKYGIVALKRECYAFLKSFSSPDDCNERIIIDKGYCLISGPRHLIGFPGFHSGTRN